MGILGGVCAGRDVVGRWVVAAEEEVAVRRGVEVGARRDIARRSIGGRGRR